MQKYPGIVWPNKAIYWCAYRWLAGVAQEGNIPAFSWKVTKVEGHTT